MERHGEMVAGFADLRLLVEGKQQKKRLEHIYSILGNR
jgi:hypothetical protein